MSSRYLRNTDPRFHWIELRSRWFLGLALAAILGVVAVAMWRLEWFRPVQRLDLRAMSGEGIQRGMPVKLSGFRIGKVTSVELEQANRVRVKVDLFKEYAPHIRRDSQAVVSAGSSLIGDRFIAMTAGSQVAPAVSEGDELALSEEQSISKMVETIKEEIRPVLDDVREIVGYLNDPQGDFKTSLGQIRSVTGSLDADVPLLLDETRGGVKRFDEWLAGLQDPAQPLQKSLVQIDETSAALRKDLPEILRKLDNAATTLDAATGDARKFLQDADGVVADVRAAVKENAPRIPPLLNEGQATVRDAGDVARSVKNMWPVKGGVPETKEKVLRAESED